ncbi:MAG: chromosome segregation protein SMC [Nitrospirota bacterium]|nr:MAG: chromosome segregation protein SMC [Nitrospirota bacterium]
MNLQKLIVNGFKSFPEAKIEFPRGITAVVGPNGTGKSNIVDAILWSLGEQSPKTLRSERMEDVIFNGTEMRKPIGMVEVSLVLEGVTSQELEAVSALGEELGQSSEIMITRRLFRDGESEYYLNKVPCRLKDIRSLVWASRAGTKGHSVIEQGNIDQLLSASPHERREFIEETAGIIRYKKQKAEALRKLDSTEQNLLRVRDILNEVRRQLRSLDRQAKQAQNYQILQTEAKTLEIQILSWDYRTLFESKQQIEKELEQSEAQELTRLGEESRLIAEQEEAKLSLASVGESVTHFREQVREIEHQMAQALTSIEVERNRLEQFEQQHEQAMHERLRLIEEAQQAKNLMEGVQERLGGIRSEMENLTRSLAGFEQQAADCGTRRSSTIEEVDRLRQTLLDLTLEKTNCENRLKSIAETRQALAKRVERLSLEQEEAQAQHHRLSTEAEDFRLRGAVLQETLEQIREKRGMAEEAQAIEEHQWREIDARLVDNQKKLAGTESELRALEAIIHEELGYGPAGEIEETSARGACREIKEAFAERMEVSEEVEKAIEAALGDRIKSWVVDNPRDAIRAISTFKEQGLGRGTFLPLQLPGFRAESEQAGWPDLQEEPGVHGPALRFVEVPAELKSATTSFLHHVFIVENIDAALKTMERHEWFQGRGPTLVTLEGEIVYPNGVITGGSTGDTVGILRRRREIVRLKEQAEEFSHIIEEDQRKRDTHSTNLKELQIQIQELNTSAQETEVRLVDLQKEEGVREQALPELSRRVETIRMEQVSEEGEDARLLEETTGLGNRLTALEAEFVEQNCLLHTTTENLGQIDLDIKELNAQITEARMTLNTLQTRQTHEEDNLNRLEEEGASRNTRLQELDQKLEELSLQTRQSQDERIRNETLFEELEKRKESEETQLRTGEDQYNEVLEKTKVLDRQLSEAREALADSLKARGAIDVRLAEVRTNLNNVESTLTGTYEVSLDSLTEGGPLRPSTEGPDAQDLEQPSGTPEDWREQLQTVRKKLERMGPINLAAIEEHHELEERYQFLVNQEEDLTTSIQSLQEIIQRLNQTTSQLFSETFQALQEKFNEIFTVLFAGGRAELILVEPEESEEDSGKFKSEPGVEIVAQPPGKRLKNLAMLSGGEKTLTVLALLFSSFLIKPSPFCVLDEVDAPLDEANVARFSQFLTQMAERSQFIIITHNKRTMEVADSLFGVTMEEPGVSKMVSVRINEMESVPT